MKYSNVTPKWAPRFAPAWLRRTVSFGVLFALLIGLVGCGGGHGYVYDDEYYDDYYYDDVYYDDVYYDDNWYQYDNRYQQDNWNDQGLEGRSGDSF